MKHRRIDAHVHLWSVKRGDYTWMSPDFDVLYRDFDTDDLEPLLKRCGFDQAVLVQAAPTIAETEFLLEIAGCSESIAGVVGWADLASPTLPDDIRRLRRNDRFKGLRPMIQDIADPDWMLSDPVSRGFEAVAASGIAFDFLVYPMHLVRVREVLSRHPDLRTVIDHGAKPAIAEGAFAQWASDMAAIAAETDACCKLSGLVTEAGERWTRDQLEPYVDHLLEHFGPERLMFGSDWPVVRLAASYESWCRCAISMLAKLGSEAYDDVFGLTAARFYRL